MTIMDFPSSPINGQQTTDGRYYFDSTVGAEGAWRANPVPVGGLPAGSIIQWASNTIPANWLLCDGSAVSRTVYPSLFAAIGTTYGAGNGSTTFNLPDLRGRVPVGKNGGTFGTLAGTGGAETHTLSVNEMPSHTHTQDPHTHTQNAHTHAGNGGNLVVYVGSGGNIGHPAGSQMYGTGAANATATNQNTTATNQNTGGGQAHNNLQPYLVVNYIIKATAGWTAGDSELATRVGALETNPVVSGNMSIAGGITVSGRVSHPNLPAFFARPTANKTTSGVGDFTTVDLNVGGYYSTTTKRFTAPYSGTYYFSGQALPATNTNVSFFGFEKNGVRVSPLTYMINNDETISMSMPIQLAANDYVEMRFYSDGYEYAFCHFSGHLLG